MIKTVDIRNRLKDIEEYLRKNYREGKEDKKRDWRTYEQNLMNRIKVAVKSLEPLVDKATSFEIHKERGDKKKTIPQTKSDNSAVKGNVREKQ